MLNGLFARQFSHLPGVAQLRPGTWLRDWPVASAPPRFYLGAPWQQSAFHTSQDTPPVSRRQVALPARLTWKDASGAVRFTSVVTRDVSEAGVFVDADGARRHPALPHRPRAARTDRTRHGRRPDASARRPRLVGGLARRAVPAVDGDAVRIRVALPGRPARARCRASARRTDGGRELIGSLSP